MRVCQINALVRGVKDVVSLGLGSDWKEASFKDLVAKVVATSYDGTHTLAPVLNGCADVFYTMANSVVMQRRWAEEKGMPKKTTLRQILEAQIEEHRAEVVYVMDPASPEAAVLDKLPASVRARVVWWAAPGPLPNFRGAAVVSSIGRVLSLATSEGIRAFRMWPSHDPILDARSRGIERDIDTLFVGTYSQYHVKRGTVLARVAEKLEGRNVVYALAQTRISKLWSALPVPVPPWRHAWMPHSVRRKRRPAVYGVKYAEMLARAKVVINVTLDMAGVEKGNMRCWETMSAGALLVTEDGEYPAGMQNGRTLVIYNDPNEAAGLIERAVTEWQTYRDIARAGNEMVKNRYSKDAQWRRFQEIVAALA